MTTTTVASGSPDQDVAYLRPRTRKRGVIVGPTWSRATPGRPIRRNKTARHAAASRSGDGRRPAPAQPLPPIAFLYERAAGEAVGHYRIDLPVLGDWDFNLRFAERFGSA